MVDIERWSPQFAASMPDPQDQSELWATVVGSGPWNPGFARGADQLGVARAPLRAMAAMDRIVSTAKNATMGVTAIVAEADVSAW